MRTTLKVAILTIAIGGISAPVFAYPDQQPMPIAPKSIYIDGNLGFALLSTPREFIAGCDAYSYTGCYNSNYRTGGFSGGADIGYRFAMKPTFLLGAEAGYSYNGKSQYTADYRLAY